jgi:hypothetical protein
LLSKNYSEITTSGHSGGGAVTIKKQTTKNSGDCLEIIQEEARSSKGRKDCIFAAGYAKSFEEGKESGCALGLAEGIEKGRESAACANTTQIASLKAGTGGEPVPITWEQQEIQQFQLLYSAPPLQFISSDNNGCGGQVTQADRSGHGTSRWT